MASRLNQGAEGSIPSPQLEALLDKLVAVRMDLEPICRVGKERAHVVASLDSIADACDVLNSAIEDVPNSIGQVDGMNDPHGLPARIELGTTGSQRVLPMTRALSDVHGPAIAPAFNLR
jgi:hypothetical protein